MRKPTVVVISMGGTISCSPSPDAADGLVPASDPAASLALDDVMIHSVPWSLTDSAEITFNELHRLADEVRAQVASGADGVIVTQGTDTLEETAYAFSLLRPADKAVVFTAAMRAPGDAGSDAVSNLRAAIFTAIDPELPHTAFGAIAVMNDQIHSARWVQKCHTQRLDAFTSGEHGVLGVISEGRPTFLQREREPVIPRLLDTDAERKARVALLTAAVDQDTRLIEALPRLEYAGAVIEALGGGHVSSTVAEALGEVALAMPVVFGSRTRAGAVLTRTYGSPGAELDLIRRGCVPAGLLPAVKARVLLTLLLRSGYSKKHAEASVMAEGICEPFRV